MTRLHENAPIARAASDYLWQTYLGNDATIGSGISAMPSMHVAMTTWAAIAVSAAWPRLRVPMWSFASVIFVGSFALGWHYVSDSVAGALGAIACWKLASIYVASSVAPKRHSAATAAQAGT
jgi:membrane-associated phospholipid phosphatase